MPGHCITDISIPRETKYNSWLSSLSYCAYAFVIMCSEHALPLQNANTFNLCQGWTAAHSARRIHHQHCARSTGQLILVQPGKMILMSQISRAWSGGPSLSLGMREMTDVIWGCGWKRKEAIYMYIYQTAWLVQLITPEIRSVLLMLISAVSLGFLYSLWLGVCK